MVVVVEVVVMGKLIAEVRCSKLSSVLYTRSADSTNECDRKYNTVKLKQNDNLTLL